jgi:hypothetical protein
MIEGKHYRVLNPKRVHGDPRIPGVMAIAWTDGLIGSEVTCERTRPSRAAQLGEVGCREFTFVISFGGYPHVGYPHAFSVMGATDDEIEQRLAEQFEVLEADDGA